MSELEPTLEPTRVESGKLFVENIDLGDGTYTMVDSSGYLTEKGIEVIDWYADLLKDAGIMNHDDGATVNKEEGIVLSTNFLKALSGFIKGNNITTLLDLDSALIEASNESPSVDSADVDIEEEREANSANQVEWSGEISIGDYTIAITGDDISHLARASLQSPDEYGNDAELQELAKLAYSGRSLTTEEIDTLVPHIQGTVNTVKRLGNLSAESISAILEDETPALALAAALSEIREQLLAQVDGQESDTVEAGTDTDDSPDSEAKPIDSTLAQRLLGFLPPGKPELGYSEQYGMSSGPDVRKLQEVLVAFADAYQIDYPKPSQGSFVDGLFGPNTKDLLIKVQEFLNESGKIGDTLLTPDGVYGDKTKDALTLYLQSLSSTET